MTSGGLLASQTYTYSPTYPPPSVYATPFSGPTNLDFFPNPPLVGDYTGPAYGAELQLQFTGNILNGGVSLIGGPNGPSFECINSFICPSPGNLDDFGVRFITGSLGIPEP